MNPRFISKPPALLNGNPKSKSSVKIRNNNTDTDNEKIHNDFGIASGNE
jgi:hypothetical protein